MRTDRARPGRRRHRLRLVAALATLALIAAALPGAAAAARPLATGIGGVGQRSTPPRCPR